MEEELLPNREADKTAAQVGVVEKPEKGADFSIRGIPFRRGGIPKTYAAVGGDPPTPQKFSCTSGGIPIREGGILKREGGSREGIPGGDPKLNFFMRAPIWNYYHVLY